MRILVNCFSPPKKKKNIFACRLIHFITNSLQYFLGSSIDRFTMNNQNQHPVHPPIADFNIKKNHEKKQQKKRWEISIFLCLSLSLMELPNKKRQMLNGYQMANLKSIIDVIWEKKPAGIQNGNVNYEIVKFSKMQRKILLQNL